MYVIKFLPFLIVTLFLAGIVETFASPAKSKATPKKAPTKVPVIDELLLPTLDLVIKEWCFNMTKLISESLPEKLSDEAFDNSANLLYEKRIVDFYKIGVSSTLLLLRLKSTDFTIMQYDWSNNLDIEGYDKALTPNMISLLRSKISYLTAVATVPEAPPVDPKLILRFKGNGTVPKESSATQYGRMYIPHSVQSFDYIMATFGNRVPHMGTKRAVFANPPDGCPVDKAFDTYHSNDNDSTMHDYNDTYIIAQRGRCSFFMKTLNIQDNYKNIAGIIIVNNVNKVEAPSSGLGVDPEIKQRDVEKVTVPVASVPLSTWSKLKKSLELCRMYSSDPDCLRIALVPLICDSRKVSNRASNPVYESISRRGQGDCLPITDVEQEIAYEVSSGQLSFQYEQDGRVFASPPHDFVSSSTGGALPYSEKMPVKLSLAYPLDGCAPLEIPPGAPSDYYVNSAVVMTRGVCAFDEKLRNAERQHATLAIIVNDKEENALQHIGTSDERIGLSGVLIAHSTGQLLFDLTGYPDDASYSNIGKFTVALTHYRSYFNSTSASAILSGGNFALSTHWIDLAHLQWLYAEDTKVGTLSEYLIQLDTLISRYLMLNNAMTDAMRKSQKQLASVSVAPSLTSAEMHGSPYNDIIKWLENRKRRVEMIQDAV